MGNCFLYKRGFGGGFGGGGGGEDIPEIEKTASGKIISIHDSMEKPLKGLRLFGKTTQNGTPSPENPVPLESVGDGGSVGVTVCGKNLLKVDFTTATKNGVTFTPTGDGGVRVTGTTQNYPFQPIGKIFLRADVWYRASLNGTVLPKMFLRIINRNVDPVSIATTSENAFKPKVTGWHDFEITINPGFDGETTLYPMIELGDTATAYEPYKDGSVTISTPNGLPGIHVSEGGNYTDENGWQWVCDEIDFAGRKYVQRIDCFIFTGNESIGTGNRVASHGFYCFASSRTVQGKVNSESMCNNMKTRKNTLQAQDGNSSESVNLASGGSGTNFPRLCIAHSLIGTSESSSVSECKSAVQNWLKAQYDEGSPLIVFSQLETPIETPLTSQELAQYAALRTLSPSTTLYNDADSYMEVKYMAKGG